MEPLEQVHNLYGRGRWIVDRLTYWKEAAELTKQVIESTGMDPNKVTPDELDDAKHRFMVFAGSGSSTMTIVSWRCLVSYHFTLPFSIFHFPFSGVGSMRTCYRSRTGTINLLANVHPNGGF